MAYLPLQVSRGECNHALGVRWLHFYMNPRLGVWGEEREKQGPFSCLWAAGVRLS